MEKTNAELKARLYLASVVILAAGLCGAALIYLTAGDASSGTDSYIIVDGVAYPLDPLHSKAYVRELQRFGGKAAVVFDEIYRWFEGLWQGKSLAITIAWISALVSLGVFLFAASLPAGPHPDIRGDAGRDGSV